MATPYNDGTHLHLEVTVKKNILWLDIPMKDTSVMAISQGLHQLDENGFHQS